MDLLLFHIVYLVLAIVFYRFLRRWLEFSTVNKTRLVRSAVLAVLFSPGLAWAWPFAVPTFALFALLFIFIPTLLTATEDAYTAFMFSFGPMFLSWILILYFSVIGGWIKNFFHIKD